MIPPSITSFGSKKDSNANAVIKAPTVMKNIHDDGFDMECLNACKGFPSSYLQYYYSRQAKLQHLKAGSKSRAQVCMEIEEQLLELYSDNELVIKPALLEERGGYKYSLAAVSLIDSIANDKKDVHVVNIKNNGTLALKYQFGVNISAVPEGKNQAGKTFKLSDYIYFDVVEGVNGETAPFADRDAAMKDTTETTKISAGYSKAGKLDAESDYVYLAMVIYMPTTVGNEANYKTDTAAPQINLGINLYLIVYFVAF